MDMTTSRDSELLECRRIFSHTSWMQEKNLNHARQASSSGFTYKSSIAVPLPAVPRQASSSGFTCKSSIAVPLPEVDGGAA